MEPTRLTITPLRSALLAGHDNETHLLVRAHAPQAPDQEAPRQPLNLSLVIDRSGSMSGQPLAEAVRCARFMVDGMHPDDHCSLVAYDNQVQTLVPSRPIGDRRAFHQALEQIHSGGCTALFGGWFEGAGQAAKTATGRAVSRVLLLSDGCANEGLTEPEQIAPRCAEMAEAGVTTSTYGLGHHFNERLMGEMARAGLGSCYYGESAEDLMDPFREEFDLLSALCGRRLRLRLDTPGQAEVQVLNGYSRDADGRWILPDLAYGADVWALVKVRVPAYRAGTGENVALLSASLEYVDTRSGETRSVATALSLPAVGAQAFEAIVPDQTVRARIQELRSAELQERIRDAALEHDWDQVDRLLKMARKEARDNPWLEEGLAALERYARQREAHTLSKEAYYRSSRLRARRVSSMEACADYSAAEESQQPSYLRRKREEGKKMDGNEDRNS